MKGCIVCKNEGVIYCVKNTQELMKFSKKQLSEIIEDIIETKERGGKL